MASLLVTLEAEKRDMMLLPPGCQLAERRPGVRGSQALAVPRAPHLEVSASEQRSILLRVSERTQMLVPHPDLPERLAESTLAEPLFPAQRCEAHVNDEIDTGIPDAFDERTDVVTLVAEGGHRIRPCRQQLFQGHVQDVGDVSNPEDSWLLNVALFELPQ